MKTKTTVNNIFYFLVFTTSLFLSTILKADEWDNNRAKALAWLLLEQTQQGSWGDRKKRIVSVSETLKGLENVGMKPHSSYQRGFSWLANTKAHSVDSLSRQISILGKNGYNVDSLINHLNNAEGTSFGWGSYSGSSSGALDTALALLAYNDASQSSQYSGKGYCYLHATNAKVQSFSPNNVWLDTTAWGWSYTTVRWNNDSRWSTKPAILPTAYAILALAEMISKGEIGSVCPNVILDNRSQKKLGFFHSDTILRGVKWLRGLYVNGVYRQSVEESGIRSTALAYLAISKAQSLGIVGNEVNLELIAAREYLASAQLAGGSWEHDAFTTSLVLQVLPSITMQDSDGDNLPDLVEAILGSNPFDSGSGFVGGIDDQFNLPGLYALAVKNIEFSTQYSIPHVNGETLTTPYNWTLLSGELPPGVSLVVGNSPESAVVISGTPTVAGNYSFIYQVNSANNISAKMTGWISVKDPNSDDYIADDDGDGLPTIWELQHGLNPLLNDELNGASGDFDGDGITNLEEFQWGLDPNSADTDADNDGIDDRFEIDDNDKYAPTLSLHPLEAGDALLHFDSDTLNNKKEYELGTDLRKADTDGDGMNDSDEVAVNRNPLIRDNILSTSLIVMINDMLIN